MGRTKDVLSRGVMGSNLHFVKSAPPAVLKDNLEVWSWNRLGEINGFPGEDIRDLDLDGVHREVD